MKRQILILALSLLMGIDVKAGLVITGILDGPLAGGMPKAIELYASAFEQLEFYTLWRSVNCAPFGEGPGSISPLCGNYDATFIYLVKPDHVEAFHEVFGNGGTFANVLPLSIITGNGNEGFQLRDSNGVIIDQVWFENVEDSYRDSYWYRINGTGPDSSWMSSHWVALGNDGLDGLDAAGVRAAVPFGDYAIHWLGNNTDWNDPSNWSMIGTPGYHTNVIIPDSMETIPVITNTMVSPARCRSLGIGFMAGIIIPSGSVIQVGEGPPPQTDQGMTILRLAVKESLSNSRK